jgi:hypothetical protein
MHGGTGPSRETTMFLSQCKVLIHMTIVIEKITTMARQARGEGSVKDLHTVVEGATNIRISPSPFPDRKT